MIEESFLICQKLSDDINVEYDLIKSINDVVFKELYQAIRKPKSLILSVQPLGSFYYRDKKTVTKLLKANHDDPDNEEFNQSLADILEMYKVYREDKLNFKYEKFGKESHEAYLLAKEQKKLPTTKEDKPE